MTTMKTEDLISELAAKASPAVRRLRPPSGRVMLWLAVSMPWVTFVVGAMGIRPVGSRASGGAYHRRDGRDGGLLRRRAGKAQMGARVACNSFAGLVGTSPGRLLERMDGSWSRRAKPCARLGVLARHRHGGLRSGDRHGTDALSHCANGPMLSVGLGGLAAGGLGNFGLRLFHI